MTVYRIPGEQIDSLEAFYRVIGQVINGDKVIVGEVGYFGRNLDAFNDCLRGGMGTPPVGEYRIKWLQSSQSREALGYPETVRQLELKLEKCDPTWRQTVLQELQSARQGVGPTVFDWLVKIIRDNNVPLDLL
jgi:RNAse (barnase) inhibitor barstar